ncbi:MAG: hypothetical protein ABSG98_10360 [Anaerolineales bacterium]
MTQESVLGDELGAAARDITRCGENNRMTKRQGEVEKNLTQRRNMERMSRTNGLTMEDTRIDPSTA